MNENQKRKIENHGHSHGKKIISKSQEQHQTRKKIVRKNSVPSVLVRYLYVLFFRCIDTNDEERDKGKTVEYGKAFFETEKKVS